MKTLIHLVCLVVFALPLQAETWKITSLEWPPYSGKDLEGNGTAIEALRSALKTKGIELVVEFYPWERAQKMASDPGYVGYFPAWPEEVGEGFVGSNGVQNSTVGVLFKKGADIQWTSVNELFSKYKVGLIKSYVYPAAIQKASAANPGNTSPASNEETLLKKLAGGRMDVAITDPKVMLFYAQQANISDIEASTATLEEKPLVVSFADKPENQSRLKLLNEILSGQ